MMLVIVYCSVHLVLVVLFVEIEKDSDARRMLLTKSVDKSSS